MMALILVVGFVLGVLNWLVEIDELLISDDEHRDMWKEEPNN